MAAKSSLVCLFQEKEENRSPPMQHLFERSGLFTTLLFPPVPVRFVYCNVCALAHRMQLSTHSRAMFPRRKCAILAKWQDWNVPKGRTSS